MLSDSSASSSADAAKTGASGLVSTPQVPSPVGATAVSIPTHSPSTSMFSGDVPMNEAFVPSGFA